MKIVCIDNRDECRMSHAEPYYFDIKYYLSVNKIYEVVSVDEFDYTIEDDRGVTIKCPVDRFVELKKYRKDKVKKLYEN